MFLQDDVESFDVCVSRAGVVLGAEPRARAPTAGPRLYYFVRGVWLTTAAVALGMGTC